MDTIAGFAALCERCFGLTCLYQVDLMADCDLDGFFTALSAVMVS
jgi:hypothetical protein